MKVYKHKYYDFEGGFMPLGHEWKEPEIFAESLNDDDYELCTEGEDCDIEHLKNLYKTRIADGEDLNLENTAKGYIMIVDGTITSLQMQTFGIGTEGLTEALSKGYWHSAYNIVDGYTPEAVLLEYYTELKQKIKDYVNTNYESYFHV